MRQLIAFFSTIFFLALMDACSSAPSVTVEANHISAISAVLVGKVNLGSTVATDLKIGFQYSLSSGILPSNATTIEVNDANENYNYTTSITGLKPATTYYFRSFVHQNGQYTYGETKEFTTKDVSSILETKIATNVVATKSTLNAKLDLTDVSYDHISYGFYWGTSQDYDFLRGVSIGENEYSASLTCLCPLTQYWYKAYVRLDDQVFYGDNEAFTTESYTALAGEAVDLGLSVKWSSMNLGATSPTDYGDYFAWGETVPKYNYTWKSYKLCNGSWNTTTKYNVSDYLGGIVDNKTEFKDYDYEDDAARQVLGGKWRIPTEAEWSELKENCAWTWTTQNGVEGVLVKSKVNGNSIFLPAAGIRDGTHFDIAHDGGRYWSSSLYIYNPYKPLALRFYDYSAISLGLDITILINDRYIGTSVRPVSE